MLKIDSLSKEYVGGMKAVDRVSLNVEDGEIYGFIGHNGAGKTTTIKCISGILKFEHGSITINGKDIKKNSLECKREMAYIPDNPDLYESLTAIKYLNFIGDMYDIEPGKRKELIEKYAAEFDIEKHLGDTIGGLSHGMKQKIVLISAFIHEPKLIIMDEPFVGLDPAASFVLKKIMREHCDNGNSIFFSTHVLEVAEKLCDSVGIMKHGHLILNGKTSELVKEHSLEDVFMGTLSESE